MENLLNRVIELGINVESETAQSLFREWIQLQYFGKALLAILVAGLLFCVFSLVRKI